MAERFLISRLSSLGDVVCTLPAATALKRGFPACEVAWVVDPRFADVVERCGAVDTVIRAKPGLKPKSWPRIEGEFDAALDLQGLFKSGIVVARANAKVKVGFHWQRECAWLFSQRVLPDPSSSHVVDQYVDVARAIGGVADVAEFALAPTGEDIAGAKSKLAAAGGKEPYVVLNPGAGWITKRWPAEHCAELIARLAARGLCTVLIGGKGEADRAVVQDVVSRCSVAPVDLGGQTSIGELIALISGCAAHVGGDTGSTHIAAALAKPAIGLYSITKPERTGAYGQLGRCLYDADSLGAIRPDRVLAALEEAMP